VVFHAPVFCWHLCPASRREHQRWHPACSSPFWLSDFFQLWKVELAGSCDKPIVLWIRNLTFYLSIFISSQDPLHNWDHLSAPPQKDKTHPVMDNQ